MDQKHIIGWFEELRDDRISVISFRAALRTIPTFSESFSEIRSDDRCASAHYLLRGCLTLGVTIMANSKDLLWKAGIPDEFPSIEDQDLHLALKNCINLAHEEMGSYNHAYKTWSSAVVYFLAYSSGGLASAANLEKDVSDAKNNQGLPLIFDFALNRGVPEDSDLLLLLNSLHNLRSVFDNNPEVWSFWRDWYQGFLDGTPLDWNLQREVALIPDADWDKGPMHIAGVIERIRKKYDLEQEIAALKGMLRLSAINEEPADRLHNRPPEAIDDEIALGKEITLVWEQLDQLDEEIAKPEPSPDLLSKIAQALWDASKRIMAYCGSLADVALKKAAEELGRTGTKWAIRVGALGVAAHSEGVQSVAKAVEEFVKTLLQ